MEYEHNKITLQSNGGAKSIVIKKEYVHHIKFDRTSVNLNIKGLQLISNETIFEHIVCLHDVIKK